MKTTESKNTTSKAVKEIATKSKLLIAVLFLIGVSVLALLWLFISYKTITTQPLSNKKKSITFEIKSGESVNSIIQNLVKAEILTNTNAKYFEAYLKLNKLGSDIQAGTFELPVDLTMDELAKSLEKAGTNDVWIRLPEGLRSDEYAEIIRSEVVSSEDASFDTSRFIALLTDKDYIDSTGLLTPTDSLEGYIFPDNYLIPAESTEEDILNIILENFRAKVTDEYSYEDIIIASLLERESVDKDEKRMIADITKRKLDEGSFLNIEATLLYYHKDWTYELTDEDFQLDHPYNTFVYLGLPPTPICNPSLASIEAALNPQKNDYYYYLHDEDGIIHYAKTWEGHAENKNTYLR